MILTNVRLVLEDAIVPGTVVFDETGITAVDAGRSALPGAVDGEGDYLAPGLVGPEKAARGKTPTDVWWQTIVSPTGAEKTGYPTQKPVKILERIVRVHSEPGDLVVDPFAGSGTTGEAAARLGRDYLLVDENPEAVRVMRERLAWDGPEVIGRRPDGEGAESGLTPTL